ncbi:hypothetical protein ACFWU5_16285 [Nocardia sp. NPDC058640]|uniref:DUF7427 family protein n=1 Tax=Nocardia sp. NPDC058640 TaxID=3346571 RepID=UPI00365C784E
MRGTHAWLLLVAATTLYELHAHPDELLTAVCERARQHHPILVPAAIITTAAHLLGLIPTAIDPFHHAHRLVWRHRSAQEATAPTT